MRIVRGWLEVSRIEVTQEYLSGFISALDDIRGLMLPTRPDRELALRWKSADRQAVIGRRTGLISVKLEVRLVDIETIIQPSKGFHRLERDDGVALAVEQPDPAIDKVGGIVDQALARVLSDDPD